MLVRPACLNPFEVREVLQAKIFGLITRTVSLNPFEVREVLQGYGYGYGYGYGVSIPLKSGRCCKTTSVVQRISGIVSIPLKSGRCCKQLAVELRDGMCLNPFEVREVLQAYLHKTW